MDAYTISKLASAAGVSVRIVRDYLLRGLMHPAQRTDSDFGCHQHAEQTLTLYLPL